MNVEFYFFSVSKIYILVVKFNPFLSLNWYKHSTRIPKNAYCTFVCSVGIVERVCVGEGWAVVTIDEAVGGPSAALVAFCACQ